MATEKSRVVIHGIRDVIYGIHVVTEKSHVVIHGIRDVTHGIHVVTEKSRMVTDNCRVVIHRTRDVIHETRVHAHVDCQSLQFTPGWVIASNGWFRYFRSFSRTTMNEARQKLVTAEQKAKQLFHTIETRGLIAPGKSESQLCREIVQIAKDEFGIAEHWHKKIVRAGINTLQPFIADPPDRIIQTDDIVFFDFHPIFEGWEADLGRTYVVGNDPRKLKIKRDIEAAWQEANDWYFRQTALTGAQFFDYVVSLTKRYGYEFGNAIAGHIVGKHPHEQPDDPNDMCLDVHPDNHTDIFQLDKAGNKRHWILELQFVDRQHNIGSFFEQLLTNSGD